VFLLQTLGRRRWRIGKIGAHQLVPDVPLKILANFAPEQEWLLEPGDMLYLPPGWAHDGVAEGECMTCSIGFHAAGRDELAREVLQRMLDGADADERGPLYRDPKLDATTEPGRVPEALQAFAAQAVARLLADPGALACALGEVLSEPKRGVWFDTSAAPQLDAPGSVRLDQRTRALYDDAHVFINGESFRASGRDARLMRRLADDRALSASNVAALSEGARALLDDWLDAGWMQRGA
jgi:50S ribosomal protein L16 3-hydroxylase